VTVAEAAALAAGSAPAATVVIGGSGTTVTPSAAVAAGSAQAPLVLVTVPAVPVSGGATYASSVLADSPLAYYRLGEPSGTTATDAGSAAQNATYVNTPTLGVANSSIGDGNTAVTFNGSNQYANAGNNAVFDLTGPMTIEAWINPAAVGANQRFLAKDGAYGFGIHTTGKLKFTTFGIKDYISVTAPTLTASGTWRHVAAVFDSAQDVTFFMDGVQYDTIAGTTNPNVSVNPLIVGARSVSLEFFNGTGDEVALYPSALSAARILAHFNAGPNTGAAPFAATATAPAPVPVVVKTAAAAVAAGAAGGAVPAAAPVTVAAVAAGASPAPVVRVLVPVLAQIATGVAPAPTVISGAGGIVTVPAALAVGSTGPVVVAVTSVRTAAAAAASTPAPVIVVLVTRAASTAQGSTPAPTVIAGVFFVPAAVALTETIRAATTIADAAGAAVSVKDTTGPAVTVTGPQAPTVAVGASTGADVRIAEPVR
jgi:hypothetical protein